MDGRPCSKVACSEEAVATLTYVYADLMAVLGPLSPKAEPHSYDLCSRHAERLSAPQGWRIIRHTVLGDTGLDDTCPGDAGPGDAGPSKVGRGDVGRGEIGFGS